MQICWKAVYINVLLNFFSFVVGEGLNKEKTFMGLLNDQSFEKQNANGLGEFLKQAQL